LYVREHGLVVVEVCQILEFSYGRHFQAFAVAENWNFSCRTFFLAQ